MAVKAVIELFEDKGVIFNESQANSVHSKGYIGALNNKRLELSIVEVLFLLKNGKIDAELKGKKVSEESLLKQALKRNKRFNLLFKVFEDLKTNGYVVKTALKYGFDYRVYDKGVKPGSKHAKWLIHCFNENDRYYWKDFSKMMRISHGVNKSAIAAIVDDEGDITYWESSWKKL